MGDQWLSEQARRDAFGFATLGWWRGGLRRLAVCALLWVVLTGGTPDAWAVGSLAVTAAVLVSLALRPPRPAGLHLSGALRFAPYFFRQTLRGGLDVARRAFSPGMPLNPVLVEHALRLPPGTARIFLLNTVSLLPGTLSADLRGDLLLVHGLDGALPLVEDLHRLEGLVAALFGVEAQSAHG